MAFSLNLGALSVTLGLDADAFSRGVKEAKSEWASLKSSLSSSGAALGKGIAAAGALAAGGVALVAKAASDLETELTKAAAVSQGGMANFADFKRAALEASSGSAASAKQAGESLKYLAMAGFSAQEAMVALPKTIQLASAAGLDLGRTSDLASDMLTGFGLKAADLAHVNDVLVLGFTRTNTTLELLGESMKYVGPVAQSSGQSIESMTAALGLMANVGVKGSQAGTSLRMALLQMQKPPKRAQEALAALGVQIVDSGGKMRDFVDIVGDFERAQSRFGQADFTAKVGQVVGTEAVAGFLGIINQGEGALRKLRDEMVAAKGTTADLEQQMLSTFAGQMQLAQGNIENLLATIGDAFLPVLKEFAALTTQVATSLQKDTAAQAEWSKGLTEGLHALAGMIEMSALLAQVMAVGVGLLAEAARGWQRLSGLIGATIDAYGAMATYMQDGDKSLLEANRSKVRAQYEAILALGDFGDELKKTTALADKYGAAAGKVADILNRSTITVQGQTAAVETQAEAIARASKSLAAYAAQWRGVGEAANFVEQPRWMFDGGAKPKFAGTDTRGETKTDAADRKRAAEARKRAAEEREAAKLREEIAQLELDALREKDKLVQIDLQAQAAIEALQLRKLGVVERELEVARILNRAEQDKIDLLKKQAEEREKAEKAAAKLLGSISGAAVAGAKTGKDTGKAKADEVIDEQFDSAKSMLETAKPVIGFIDSFAELLGPFGSGIKTAIKALNSAMDAFAQAEDFESGAMLGAQAAMLSLGSSYLDMITSTEAFQDNMTGLSAAFDGLGLSDFLNEFFKAWQPAIGAIISVFKSFGGAGFADFFKSAGKGFFNAVKGVLQAFLGIKKVFAYMEYGLSWIVAGLTGAVNSVVNKLADWIEDVPGLGRPSTKWINDLNREAQQWKSDAGTAIDAINSQQDELAGLSYEAAQAIFDETLEREKSTESLKELNDELRNAPQGFRIALQRYRSSDAAVAPGAGAGAASSTTIQNAYLVSHDPGQIVGLIQRKQYIKTGTTTALGQRVGAAVRARL